MEYQCFTCSGTGEVNGGPCPRCAGSGKIEACFIIAGELQRTAINDRLENIETKVADILDKCNDIFEKVNE